MAVLLGCLLCLGLATQVGASSNLGDQGEQGADEASAQGGQEGAEQGFDTYDEVLVVSITGQDTRLGDSVLHVQVLDDEDVKSSASVTVADFLRGVAGFSLLRQTSSMASHPTTQSVSLRGIGGTGASRTLVLFDGIPLNDPFAGWVRWNMVPLERLSQTEVVKGGGSGVWGNLAMGGVINLRTRQTSGTSFDTTAKLGERGLLSGALGGGGSVGDSSFYLRGEVLEFDGYPNVLESQRGPVDEPVFADYTTAYFSWQHAPSESRLLRAKASWLDEDRGNGTPLQRNDTQASILTAGFQSAGESGLWELDVFAQDQDFANFFGSASLDRTTETPTLDQFDVPSEALGLSLRWSLTPGRHHLNAGGDIQLVDGANTEHFLWTGSEFARERSAGGEQQVAGVYIHDTIEAGDRVALSVALRADRWEATDGALFIFERATGDVLTDVAYEDRDDTQLSPRLGLRYQVDDRWTLRTSGYKGFRAPTINELYRPFRLAGGIVNEANATLEPEEILGFEAGAEYAGEGVRARINAFWMEIDDPVINLTLASAGAGGSFIRPCGFVPSFGICRQRANVGTHRNRGVEIELGGRPTANWSWSIDWLLSDVEVTESEQEPQLVGLEPRLIPELSLNAQLSYSHPRFLKATLSARFVGERFADDLNEFPLDEFTMIDLSLRRPLGERLEVFAGVQNLLDEETAIDATATLIRVAEPRLVHAGLRFSFGG